MRIRSTLAMVSLVSVLVLSACGNPGVTFVEDVPAEGSEPTVAPPTAIPEPSTIRIDDMEARCEELNVGATLQALFGQTPISVFQSSTTEDLNAGVCVIDFEDGSSATVTAFRYATPQEAANAYTLQRAADEALGPVTDVANVGASAYTRQVEGQQLLYTFTATFFFDITIEAGAPIGAPQLTAFSTFATQALQSTPTIASADEDQPQGSILIEPADAPQDSDTPQESGSVVDEEATGELNPTNPASVCSLVATDAELEGVFSRGLGVRSSTGSTDNVTTVTCEADFQDGSLASVTIEFHEDEDDAEDAYSSVRRALETQFVMQTIPDVGTDAYLRQDGADVNLYTYAETYYVEVLFRSSPAVTAAEVSSLALLTMEGIGVDGVVAPQITTSQPIAEDDTSAEPAPQTNTNPAVSVPANLEQSLTISNGNVFCNNLPDPGQVAGIFGKPVVRISFNEVADDGDYGPRLICTVAFEDSSVINLDIREYASSTGAQDGFQYIFPRPGGSASISSVGSDAFGVLTSGGISVYTYNNRYYVQIAFVSNSGESATVDTLSIYAGEVMARLQ